MDIFPKFLISQIISLLDERYESIFVESILTGNESKIYSTDFESYVSEALSEFLTNDSDSDDVQEVKNNIVRNSNKMKKSWVNSFNKELANPSSVQPASRTITKELDAYKVMTPEELYRAFGVNRITEIEEMRVKEVEKWKKNNEFNFTSYRYFEYKKPFQKLAAFKNDLILSIINIINEQFDGSLEGAITQRVVDLIENPIFSANKVLLQLDTTIDEISNTPILFNDYEVSEDYILRTLIRDPKSNNIKLSSCYVLDERDSEVIDMIYSKIKPNFYRDKSIEIDIGEIVKKVYPNQNGYSYNDAEDRIMKIAMYQIQGLIKEKENIKDTKFIINFFDHAVVTTDEISNKRIARIVFGEILYNRYIKNKTVKVSSYQLRQIKERISKILVYSFQKERLERSVSRNNYIHSEEYNYLYFKNKVRFRSRKKIENMKEVETSLEEFKKQNFLIKEYKKTPDSFIIEFYPLSEEEREFFGITQNLQLDN